jgi:hypothetical protein
VGIGVGTSIAGLVLLVVAVWWILRRRRQQQNAPPSSEATFFDGKAELPSVTVAEKREESSGQELHEKSGEGMPAEMVNSPRYELEGSWHGNEMHEH